MPSRLLLVLALACAPMLAGAEADEQSGQQVVSELRAGVLAHDLDGLWSGFRRESGVDLSGEMVFYRRGLPLPWGRLRPNLGFSINTHGDTSQYYAGMLWELDSSFGAFACVGLGAAIHDGWKQSRTRNDKKELGSRVQFRPTFELGYAITPHHRLMVSFAHISNGSTAWPNQGLDTLGLRYGYRF